MAAHPHTRSRQPRAATEVVRAMVYAPDAKVAEWIEDELARGRVTWQVGRTIEQVVAGLTEDPPPRAQVLVVDFDAIAPADLLYLHAIREQGWFGIVVGLGDVPEALRRSLGIERVIVPPYKSGSLGESIGNVGIMMATTRIERFVP